MVRPLILAAALAAFAPALPAAAAQKNAQLAASVQHRLDRLGFRDVDARELSTRQLAMLHLKLQGPIYGGVGLNNRWINLRSEVQVILNLEEGEQSF